jgi:hypothetical protein
LTGNWIRTLRGGWRSSATHREVTGNVAMTCRYYGISRQVFYTWYRYETEGLAGLRDGLQLS